MGNKLGRRRQVVDEKYTRPQGLYLHKDVDHKKLRKLILDSKLAPCYPGDDECVNNSSELEECPICFLYYPSLNRSRCCMKGICTECFLQMKTPNSTHPTQCPFCKTSNYAVEYRGVKTKEEKGIEQIEEQRVIEAKIRMRQQELQDEEERMLKRKDMCSSSSINGLSEIEYCSTAGPSFASAIEGSEVGTSHGMCSSPAIRPSLRPRQNREDEFDLDLEDLMVMEAIWLSIQEKSRQRTQGSGDSAPEQYTCAATASAGGASSSSPSGGLASAIAALAERQQTGVGEASSSSQCQDYRFSNRAEQEHEDDSGFSLQSRMAMDNEEREWGDHAGTSYAHSDEMEEVSRQQGVYSRETSEIDSGLQHMSSPIVPESFEEQMMLAMAVSLAEARARTSAHGVAWH